MPKPPSLGDAKRSPLPPGRRITAIGVLTAQHVLEQYPPSNPLTNLRRSLRFEPHEAEQVTGLPAGLFAMIEVAASEMSSREVLAFRRIYERIAMLLSGPDQPDHGVFNQRLETLKAIGLRVDEAVASGKSIGAAYLEEFETWLGRR